MSIFLSDYEFELPKKLIAQRPISPRDHCRLLVYDRKKQTIQDRYFYELPRILPPTTLVVNNSKVKKVRLLFDAGNTEILILKQINRYKAKALVRPGKRFKKGRVDINSDISVWINEIYSDGTRNLSFNIPLDDSRLLPFINTPFPPYIEADESLSSEYQTVYATKIGSIAAPTAGLHFTKKIMKDIREQGNHIEEITLHVGRGTFVSPTKEQIQIGKLHEEWYEVSSETATKLNLANHITAVGTTTLRVLETQLLKYHSYREENTKTYLFIRPGFSFHSSDALITNFHLPNSSLLMLVAAFVGVDMMHTIYSHAVYHHYRFYSFGDAMLVL